ncbi:hypothetical protein BDV23DRAFT_29279 [Aspergillus alliaceus]|uniref:Rhodopsin domain-containing protein n=1 Tax=Petromyces alliaceus TaxID=209559 RepID=A0A5N7CI68_PETAA|nr:hypothetical protein BDV23DRAFT_29279 [Aspergillus alliaceus]
MTLEGRGKSIFVVATVSLCVSLTATALRCFVRLRLVKTVGWDDILMVFAMALNIWFATCGIAGSLAGFGRKFKDFDRPQDIQTALLWWWLGQSAYIWVVTIARLSIAMLLLRITSRRRDSIVTYVVMALTVAVGVPFWFVLMLQCHPVQEFWQRTGDGHCINTTYIIDVTYLYSATACLCDFTLGLYPIYLLRDLQLSWRSKWALTGILGLGCVASAAVVVRIPFLQDYKRADFLYTTSGIAISSNVEAGLGITAGSLVTLRPLCRWFRHISHTGCQAVRKSTGSFRMSRSNGTQSSHTKLNASSPRHGLPDIESGGPHTLSTIVTSQNSPNVIRDNGSHGEDHIFQGTFDVQQTFGTPDI